MLLGTALSRDQKITLHKAAAVLKARVEEDFIPEGSIFGLILSDDRQASDLYLFFFLYTNSGQEKSPVFS